MNNEIIIDNEFDYSGYQVVRGEFFAHLNEPAITLNNETVNLNSACINKLPDVKYIHFLVNPTEKKLIVKPCSDFADKNKFYSQNKPGQALRKKQL